MDYLLARGPYILPVALVAISTYGLIANRHYVKTIVGLFLMQPGVILFYIALGAKVGATIPILIDGEPTTPLHNPLPHAMMLTAIVVGVATLGVAMAILRRLQVERGSIEQVDGGPDPEAGSAA